LGQDRADALVSVDFSLYNFVPMEGLQPPIALLRLILSQVCLAFHHIGIKKPLFILAEVLFLFHFLKMKFYPAGFPEDNKLESSNKPFFIFFFLILK
jgi:hypothetical protein